MQKKTFVIIAFWALVDIVLIVILGRFFSGSLKMQISAQIAVYLIMLIVILTIAVVRLYVKDKIMNSNHEKEVIEMKHIMCDAQAGVFMFLSIIMGTLGVMICNKYSGDLNGFRTVGPILLGIVVTVDIIKCIIQYRKTKRELDKWMSDHKQARKYRVIQKEGLQNMRRIICGQ